MILQKVLIFPGLFFRRRSLSLLNHTDYRGATCPQCDIGDRSYIAILFNQLVINAIEAMDCDWIDSHKELLNYGNTLKENPLIITFSNVVEGILEITKGDIKTIAYKNIPDPVFNELKNLLAIDIPGFIKSSTYLGWSETVSGKHPETAFFVYYHKKETKDLILCLRNMKSNSHYKPYAIISKEKLLIDLGEREIHTGKPDR